MIFSSLNKADHSAEVNCGPLSLVMVEGSPNLWIQPTKWAASQSAASQLAADVEERQLCAKAVIYLPVLGQQNDAFTSLEVAVPRRLFFAAQQRIDVN